MTYYTSDGCSYTGMDQSMIIRLRFNLGNETTFVTKEEYEALLDKRQQEKNGL